MRSLGEEGRFMLVALAAPALVTSHLLAKNWLEKRPSAKRTREAICSSQRLSRFPSGQWQSEW